MPFRSQEHTPRQQERAATPLREGISDQKPLPIVLSLPTTYNAQPTAVLTARGAELAS